MTEEERSIRQMETTASISGWLGFILLMVGILLWGAMLLVLDPHVWATVPWNTFEAVRIHPLTTLGYTLGIGGLIASFACIVCTGTAEMSRATLGIM